jgi:hypothetical protein
MGGFTHTPSSIWNRYHSHQRTIKPLIFLDILSFTPTEKDKCPDKTHPEVFIKTGIKQAGIELNLIVSPAGLSILFVSQP